MQQSGGRRVSTGDSQHTISEVGAHMQKVERDLEELWQLQLMLSKETRLQSYNHKALNSS